MKVDEQTDEYTAIGRILPKLITNSLARMINYAGSGLIKLKFQNTKLHEAIVSLNLASQIICFIFK